MLRVERHGRWRIVGVVLASCLGGIRASGQAAAMQHHDSTPPARVELRGIVDVPLLHANDHDRRPEVEVMVNGQGPYRFDVETGAREIGVSHELAQRLGLTRTAGTPDDPQYHLDRIALGTAVFEGMTVAELPAGVQGVDGVLGLPFFQNVLLTIDYPGERLRVAHGSLPGPDGKDVLQLVRIDDFWGMPITLEGKPFDAVLDTQNSGAINLPPVVADQLAFDGGLQVMGRARGAFGTTEVKGGLLSGDLIVGRYQFPTPFLDVLELPPDFPRRPNIGSALLGMFVVTLDQQHGRLRLEHAGSPVIDLPKPVRRAAPAAGHGT